MMKRRKKLVYRYRKPDRWEQLIRPFFVLLIVFLVFVAVVEIRAFMKAKDEKADISSVNKSLSVSF